jgi:hypothetical protein
MVASFNYPDHPLFFLLSFVLVFGAPVAALACIVGHVRVLLVGERTGWPLRVLLVVGSLVFGVAAVWIWTSARGPLVGYNRAMFWLGVGAGGLLPFSVLREWRR